MIEEEPKTYIKMSLEDILLEHIKHSKGFKMLVEEVEYNGQFEPSDVDIKFMLEPIEIEEKPEYFRDKSIKGFGLPRDEVRARLNSKARKKAESLRVDVARE